MNKERHVVETLVIDSGRPSLEAPVVFDGDIVYAQDYVEDAIEEMKARFLGVKWHISWDMEWTRIFETDGGFSKRWKISTMQE